MPGHSTKHLIAASKVVRLGCFNDTWYVWDAQGNESDENGRYIDRINVEVIRHRDMIRDPETREWVPITMLVLPTKFYKTVNEFDYPKHADYPNSIYEYAHAVSMLEHNGEEQWA